MTTFAEIRDAYPDWDPAYPTDWEKPRKEELDRIQKEFGINFPQEFIDFQLIECHTTPMGDFAFDYFGWANPDLGPMENLASIVQDAQQVGVPKSLAPFRCDNGDYYCCTEEGKVVIWDHNSGAVEPDPTYQWDSFIDWLKASFD
jgi:hypothetical protein